MGGPIEILCKEIGFPFDERLERTDLLVAFVAELVEVVRRTHDIDLAIVQMTGREPSQDTAEVLALAEQMLVANNVVEAAEAVHAACWRLNPEETYPTNHMIDMLQSCASALRFGLEHPCQSRHAAHAANYVWRRTYGIGLFDRHTPAWSHSWACAKFQSAIVSLLPAPEPTP